MALVRKVSAALPPTEGEDPEIIRGISLQESLEEALKEHMRVDGYHDKARKRWIEEALAGLLIHDPGVLNPHATSEIGPKSGRGIKFVRTKTRLRASLDRKVRELVRVLQVQSPDIVGHFSYLVRCAIRFRMMNAELFPPVVDSEELVARALTVDVAPF